MKANEEAERVLVLSPYLTSQTAEKILQATPRKRCEVYTVFQVENFVSGASSIRTLMKLQEHGCSLYHLPDLHAKLVLVPGDFASIGSQNVTSRGKKNKEATTIFTEEYTVQGIEDMVGPWLEEGLPITSEMIDEVNLALRPLISTMRKVQRACKALDDRVWEEERLRTAERERIEKEEKLESGRLKAKEQFKILSQKTEMVKAGLESLLERDSDNRMIARDLVSASAWWLTHPRGPVRAPKHSSNIDGSGGHWEIDFGANTLNLSYIIKVSKAVLTAWLDQRCR